MILGIDEVGRGPWAGPLVVGAVVLGGCDIVGLTDSKKLSKKRRIELDVEIRQKSNGFGLGWVDAQTIDEIGLSKALKLATKLAVEQIKTPYNEIIIDGTVNFLDGTNKSKYVTTMKKADLLVPSVSAASIIAKVARDNFMALQDDIYPGYNFKNHVGYGTAAHISAINKLGITPLHRLSFAPLMKYRRSDRSSTSAFDQNGFALDMTRASDVLVQNGGRTASFTKTAKQIGDLAEDAAAKYLEKSGHKILDRNWKTKYCEIDIISILKNVIYFTEVKYRKDNSRGGGLLAITKTKLRQMKYSAEIFISNNHNYDNFEKRLSVISVSGKEYLVGDCLDIL